MTLAVQDEKALQSLIAWWADAGFDPDEIEAPAPARKPALQTAAPAAPSPQPQRPARQRPAATAAAAMAAGFGEARKEGPDARTLAGKCETLDQLFAAIESFEGCALKRTARNTVISRGNPQADIMIVGEGPGRDEDEQGKPFVGRSGQLLDRMFEAIGLDEDKLYISNIVNWRPPGNRNPTQEEIAQCLPFIERHIAIKQPKLLILTGGVSAQSLLRASTGIMRLRGRWAEYRVKDKAMEPTEQHIPALPVLHPAYLLRRPQEKRLAWRDLLALKARLNQ
jgi:DNA polymerase